MKKYTEKHPFIFLLFLLLVIHSISGENYVVCRVADNYSIEAHHTPHCHLIPESDENHARCRHHENKETTEASECHTCDDTELLSPYTLVRNTGNEIVSAITCLPAGSFNVVFSVSPQYRTKPQINLYTRSTFFFPEVTILLI